MSSPFQGCHFIIDINTSNVFTNGFEFGIIYLPLLNLTASDPKGKEIITCNALFSIMVGFGPRFQVSLDLIRSHQNRSRFIRSDRWKHDFQRSEIFAPGYKFKDARTQKIIRGTTEVDELIQSSS